MTPDYSISPTLDAAMARTRLPICVNYRERIDLFGVWIGDWIDVDTNRLTIHETPAEATRAYLKLVDELRAEKERM